MRELRLCNTSLWENQSCFSDGEFEKDPVGSKNIVLVLWRVSKCSYYFKQFWLNQPTFLEKHRRILPQVLRCWSYRSQFYLLRLILRKTSLWSLMKAFIPNYCISLMPETLTINATSDCVSRIKFYASTSIFYLRWQMHNIMCVFNGVGCVVIRYVGSSPLLGECQRECLYLPGCYSI